MNKKISKGILFVVFSILFILNFSNNTYAATPQTTITNGQDLVANEKALQNELQTQCGVTSTSGTETVAPRAFSICKQDITYNTLYYLFSQVFQNNPVLKHLLYKGDQSSFDTSGAGTGMAGPVMTIIGTITYLVFILGSIILSYSTVKFLYKSASMGEFGGNWHSIWVPVRSLGAIILISPIGSISIIQLIVIIVALLGAALGNYLWGAFLNAFQMDMMVGSMGSHASNQDAAYAQANTMVEGQLCMDRTKKAARKASMFNTGGHSSWIFDTYDLNDHMRMLTDCTNEMLYYTGQKNGIPQAYVKNISLGNTTSCQGYYTTLSSVGVDDGYDKSVYGPRYSCGDLTFNEPAPKDVVQSKAALDMVDSGSTLSTVVHTAIPITNLVSDTSNSFTDKITPFISGVLKGYNVDSELSKLKSKVASKIENGQSFDYQTDLQNDIDNLTSVMEANSVSTFKDIKVSTNEASAERAMYMAYNTIFNNFMGAEVPDGSISNWQWFWQNDTTFKLNAYNTDNYMFKTFQTYTKDASQNLTKKHCLTQFPNNYSDVKKTIQSFGSLLTGNDPSYSSWVNSLSLDQSSVNTECVDYYFTNNTVSNDNIGIMSTLLHNNNDMNLQSLYINYNPNNSTDVKSLQQDIKTMGKTYMLKAETDKATLAAWFYVVREATGEAFSNVLKNSLDTNTPIHMRQEGFATAGGYMLNIALNQVSANDLMKKISNSVGWSSPVGGGSELYYNPDFYNKGSSNGGASSITQINSNINFSKMNLSGFFSGSAQTPENIQLGNNSASNAKDMGYMKKLLNWLENKIFSPTKYLKKAAGVPDSMTLREGIQQCFDNGNCQKPSMNPINALIYMGSDLISTSVDMILVTFVVSSLSKLTGGGSSLGGLGSVTGKTEGMWGALKKGAGYLVKGAATIIMVVLKILQIANILLEFLSPLWWSLLAAGLFLAYILPTIPFVTFLLVYLGWIVLILQLILAAPIWLLMLAIPDDNGNGKANAAEAWNFFGQLFLKPAFLIMATAFAWFLATISVFIVNTTIFSVFAPISEANTGFILSIVNVIFFYIIYVAVVFIALLNSFKLIATLPDEMSKWLNIRQSGDRGMVDSMNAERLMQTVLLVQGVNSVSGGLKRTDGMIGQAINKYHNKKSRKQQDERLNSIEDNLNSAKKERGRRNELFQQSSGSKGSDSDVNNENNIDDNKPKDITDDIAERQEKDTKDIDSNDAYKGESDDDKI